MDSTAQMAQSPSRTPSFSPCSTRVPPFVFRRSAILLPWMEPVGCLFSFKGSVMGPGPIGRGKEHRREVPACSVQDGPTLT